METKKNKRVEMESLRVPLVFLGAFIIGSIVTMSFAYKSPIVVDSKDKVVLSKNDIPIEYIVEEREVVNEEPQVVVIEIPEPVDIPIDDVETTKNIDEDEVLKIKVPPIIVSPEPPVVAPPAPIVDYPDKNAEFPGGKAEMMRFLTSELKYPEISREIGVQGRVFLEFVVNVDGSIEQVEIVRGVSRDIDREAKRVIGKMPNWIPAESNGERVRARCRIPINFELDR